MAGMFSTATRCAPLFKALASIASWNLSAQRHHVGATHLGLARGTARKAGVHRGRRQQGGGRHEGLTTIAEADR